MIWSVIFQILQDIKMEADSKNKKLGLFTFSLINDNQGIKSKSWKIKVTISNSPNCIKFCDRIANAYRSRMLLNHCFSMVVCYFWGLPNQGCVYEVIPCQFFVECLKAEQESTVTESGRTEKYVNNKNKDKKNPEIRLYQILDWIFCQFQLQ